MRGRPWPGRGCAAASARSLRVADHFLDVAEAVGPVAEVFAGDRAAAVAAGPSPSPASRRRSPLLDGFTAAAGFAAAGLSWLRWPAVVAGWLALSALLALALLLLAGLSSACCCCWALLIGLALAGLLPP